MENIKDFFLASDEVEETIKEKAKKSTPIVDIETVVVSGPDFVLRRKTGKTSKLLVVLMSRNEYYIKDERNGTITELNEASLGAFLKNTGDSVYIMDAEGNVPFWINELRNEVSWRREFLFALHSKQFRTMACKNIAFFSVTGKYGSSLWFGRNGSNDVCENDVNIAFLEKVFAIVAEEIGYQQAKEAINKASLYSTYNTNKYVDIFSDASRYGKTSRRNRDGSALGFISEKYGLDGAKRMIHMYCQTPVKNLISLEEIKGLFQRARTPRYNYYANENVVEETTFGLSKFLDYIFCECTKQGFADRPSQFYDLWRDYMNMCMLVYDKIPEKYPLHLVSDEAVLAYKTRQLRALKEAEGFDAESEKAQAFQYSGMCGTEKMSIMAPKTPQDIIDEATHQSNCVASYIPRMAHGDLWIFFLRKSKTPDKSLITVEVRFNHGNPELGQVKARFNRSPDPAYTEFVEQWFEKKFLCAD